MDGLGSSEIKAKLVDQLTYLRKNTYLLTHGFLFGHYEHTYYENNATECFFLFFRIQLDSLNKIIAKINSFLFFCFKIKPATRDGDGYFENIGIPITSKTAAYRFLNRSVTVLTK